MDAILVHASLMNIKAVGRERCLARPHEVIRSRLFWGYLASPDVKGDSEKLASKRWNIPSWTAATRFSELRTNRMTFFGANQPRAAANFAEALDSAQCPIEKS